MSLGSMPAGDDTGLRFGNGTPILNYLPRARGLRVIGKPR
jgi:hypothetical protein